MALNDLVDLFSHSEKNAGMKGLNAPEFISASKQTQYLA